MLSKFDYYRPDTLEDALVYLEKNPGTNILAGGTDLMLLLRKNAIIAKNILDVKSIPETKEIKYIPGEGLFIGASIAVNRISEDDLIRENIQPFVTLQMHWLPIK